MNIEEEVIALSQVPLFKDITKDRLRVIAFTSNLYTLSPGEFLCKKGDEADSAFVILNGSLDVIIDDDGEQEGMVVSTVNKHDMVGEIALLCSTTRTATLRCRDSATLLAISQQGLDSLMDEFKEIPRALLHSMAQRILAMNEKIIELQAS